MHAENIAAHPSAALAGVFDVHGPSAQEVSQKLGVKQFRIGRSCVRFGRSRRRVDRDFDTHPRRPSRKGDSGWKTGSLRKADRPLP
nr:hypothetical protein [Rhizobium sp. AN73]